MTILKRLMLALAFVMPAAALVTSPVMAASKSRSHHHASVHKISAHRSHSKKIATPSVS